MGELKIEQKPNVFEYDDYRKFLADTYWFFKSHFAYLSFRYFSKRAGFASPNFLKLVINGKRNISQDSVPRFASALKLSQSESEFFSHLVNFNQAKDSNHKAEAARLMIQSKGFQNIHPLQQAEFDYYANWFYIPIRELVSLSDFKEDPDWIASQIMPAITRSQAVKALYDLENLGLLKRDSAGRLVQAQKTLTTANEVTSSSVSRYHREMLKLASESIDRVPRERREISAACLPVSQATALKIKTMMQKFRHEILAIAHEDRNAEVVYQINLQMFPLSLNVPPGDKNDSD